MEEFQDLLSKANKENPRPADVKALSDLLYNNKELGLLRNGLLAPARVSPECAAYLTVFPSK